ncbi:MAG: FAD:protein FMN transferase [candidate division WOR-3 bacterium]|nr:FAD:protein FMN transferase [candidate division WOR-3 bacterium]
MSRQILISLVIVCGLILIGMFRIKEYSDRRFLMGTECEVSVYYRGRPPRKAVESAFYVIQTLDSLESFFSPKSDVSRINRYEDFIPSGHTIRVVKEAMRIGDITSGAFDITCGPLMGIWEASKEGIYPEIEDVERARQLVDYKRIDTTEGRIRIPAGMEIDLSGIVKGYACEVACKILKQNGVRAGLVNCGGDIKVFGNRVFNIGIRHPRDKKILCNAKIRDKAIVTSGDYENYFESGGKRFHHIIDPSTGYPSEGCIAVTIVTEDAMYADGLATGLMVMGLERGDSLLEKLGDVQGILIGLSSDSLVLKGNLGSKILD